MFKIAMTADNYILLIDTLKKNRDTAQTQQEKSQIDKIIWILTNAVDGSNDTGEQIYSSEWFQTTLNVLMQNMLIALDRDKKEIDKLNNDVHDLRASLGRGRFYG